MKKTLLLAILLFGNTLLHAQRWDIHVGGGVSYCRPIPIELSTPATSFFHYGFTKAGMYFSPELFFVVNDHNQFSFGYQFSGNHIGINFKGSGTENINGYIYDILELHNFSVGYQYNHLVFSSTVNLKGFVKIGLSYGNPVGYGIGSSGGSSTGGSSSYISYIKFTGDNMMRSSFWTPTSTIGVGIGPNIKNRWPLDRIALHASATICWKDPYDDYSTFEYTAYENNQPIWGTIKYQGLPFLLQVGVDYNLIRFRKE
jgi:hypothetical protein